MIIWSGLGFLIPVIAFGCLWLVLGVTDFALGADYKTGHDWLLGASLLLSGIVSWFLGRFLTARQGRVMIDKNTGEEVLVTPSNSLFFIKMQWWGPIFFFLGLVVIVRDLIPKG